VTSVHSINIWSICHNINALNAHVCVDERRLTAHTEILVKINEMLAEKHHISYTTMQIECARLDDCGGVLRDVKHSERRHDDKCG